jgi:hypothetical protein
MECRRYFGFIHPNSPHRSGETREHAVAITHPDAISELSCHVSIRLHLVGVRTVIAAPRMPR